MKRVLHIFPPCGRGGTEAVLRFLARSLAKEGIESEAYFQRDIGGGVLFDGLCPVHYQKDRTLADVLKNGRFDLVHAVTSALTMGVTETVRAVRFNGPVVVSCHGDYVAGWNRSNANAVVALTGWWAEKIRAYTDCPVEVIGNPVDLERFHPPRLGTRDSGLGTKNGKPILGWVGHSADARKNPDRLRAIMAALPADEYDWYIGDTDARNGPEEVFGPLASRVLRYGFLPHAEMPDLYREIAASGGAVISTSDTEGFPLCILEAMASGCPVLVPDLWGASEIVDNGRCGIVYAPDDTAAVVSHFRSLRDPDKWAEFSRAGRALVESRYSPEVVTRRYLEVFRQAFHAPRVDSAGYRLGWALRSAQQYLRPTPPAVSLYRPRRAQEALERALREHQAGAHSQVRNDLLEALKVFPVAFLKPWRAKFLLRTLLSRSHG